MRPQAANRRKQILSSTRTKVNNPVTLTATNVKNAIGSCEGSQGECPKSENAKSVLEFFNKVRREVDQMIKHFGKLASTDPDARALPINGQLRWSMHRALTYTYIVGRQKIFSILKGVILAAIFITVVGEAGT